MDRLLWLIPVAPLLGFVINGVWGRRLPRGLVGAVACAGPLLGFVLSVLAFLQVKGGAPALQSVFSWMLAGEVSVDVGFRVDGLSAIMILVVTGVGSLIHIYSIGYMRDDESLWRFFAYLNLFMFAMLVLVLADNLVLLFVGWEGVGLCSYLLIGYFYKDLKNSDAGNKAFITNRIGDFGFLLGMFALFSLAGSLSFEALNHRLTDKLWTAEIVLAGPFAGWTLDGVLTFATVCLFLGACGKSAQIPLYVWLPDAMAGPTPVSALIHAATMVTAGVYMIARLNFLFVMVPAVMTTVAVVAAATALLSAAIACAQNDIKKVLAYSTISQLGYMFAGVASGYFSAGMFHLVTHAFFKALLFLGAGAIIHALHGEQDIRKMGGLVKRAKPLFYVFGVGILALAGLPFFSGFVSKDAILTGVYLQEDFTWDLVFWTMLFTAGLTAFYSGRLLYVVFFGPRHDHHERLHPTGVTMMSALVVLAGLSMVGGLGLVQHGIENLFRPLLARPFPPDKEAYKHAHHLLLLLSSVGFLGGFGLATVLYLFKREWVDRFVAGIGRGIHRLAENKFYVDEAYYWLVIAPFQMSAAVLWFVVDRILIDTVMVGGAGKAVYAAGGLLRRGHRGAVNVGAAAIVFGLLAIVVFLLYRMNHG